MIEGLAIQVTYLHVARSFCSDWPKLWPVSGGSSPPSPSTHRLKLLIKGMGYSGKYIFRCFEFFQRFFFCGITSTWQAQWLRQKNPDWRNFLFFPMVEITNACRDRWAFLCHVDSVKDKCNFQLCNPRCVCPQRGVPIWACLGSGPVPLEPFHELDDATFTCNVVFLSTCVALIADARVSWYSHSWKPQPPHRDVGQITGSLKGHSGGSLSGCAVFSLIWYLIKSPQHPQFLKVGAEWGFHTALSTRLGKKT